MPDDAFTPIPGAEATEAESSRTSHEIAAEAAAEAIRGESPTTAAPGTEFKPLQSPEGQHMELVPTDQPEIPATPEVPVAEGTPEIQEVVPVPGTFTPEDYIQLQAQGVDLPIRPDEVAPEFADAYAQMAQAFVNINDSAQAKVQDAQEALLTVEDLRASLSTSEGQKRILMGLAMQNPDLFNETVQQFARMTEDPQYADTIRRSLEADVKLEAATRKERAFAIATQERKGRQVESRTNNLAKRLSVDAETARGLVTRRILENESNYGKRDISFEEVDLIVQGLASRTASKVPPAVVTPQTVAQAAQTPSTPVAQASQTPAPQAVEAATPKIPMGETDHFGDKLRLAVKDASATARSGGL